MKVFVVTDGEYSGKANAIFARKDVEPNENQT